MRPWDSKPVISAVGSASEGVSVIAQALVVSHRIDFQYSSTPLLCAQQPSPYRVEVGERRGDLQAVQVLGQTAVADLLEAKHPLDYPDRVLDLGPHSGFALVLQLLELVDPASAAVLAVGEVLCTWCAGTNYRRLPLIALIAPDSCLATMQQIRQCIHVRNVRSGSQDGVDQLRLAVNPDVRLHPEVPLFALGRLMHLRIPLAVLVLRRSRCTDNGRIHNRTVGDLDAVAVQVLIHRAQQRLAELVPLEQVAKLAD